MALIFVLWIVVLLTAIAFQMAYRGHLRARATATTGDVTQAFFLARSGVEMAISDLVENATSAAEQAALRDNSERLYKNKELGNGTYTLFAGTSGGDPTYGFIDECAKLNINTADVQMLGRLTALETGMAEAIVALREEEESFPDLEALLLIEGVDRLDLYGEDQNGNGLLDSNEDDGGQSWPPDDGDGALDGGLAAYLTTWSAARDVDAQGEARINLSEASAEDIVAALPDVTQQQAESIVYHREQNQFSSVLDLLNVELVEKQKTEQDGGNRDRNPQQGNRNPQNQVENNNQGQQGQQNQGQNGQQNQQDQGNQEQNNQNQGANNNENQEGENRENGEQANRPEGENQDNFRKTGQKAFDQDSFRKLADRVTVGEDDVVRGRINVNTAPLEILACLPEIDESVALAIVQERQNRLDGFETAFDLLDVRGIDDAKLRGILNHICVRSDVFSVRSFGVLRDGRTFAGVTAVLDRTEDTIRMLQWREHG